MSAARRDRSGEPRRKVGRRIASPRSARDFSAGSAPSPLTPSRRQELTAPVEDYLKAIYDIELSGTAAATNDIAQRLDIAAASVSGMVRRLAEHGLLAYEPYRGVRLTPAGRRAALRTIRRHRIIESYLVRALGFAWDGVHDQAERLEHAASDALIDRMANAIGEPITDPHGAPIPTREGRIDETPHRSLADLAVGARARVVRVGDKDGALLRYLSKLGLLPDVVVNVRERAPYEGPITIDADGRRVQIGSGVAARLQVEIIE